MTRQIDRVLAAMAQEGCETSQEVAEVTGLPPAHCSVYLGRLEGRGLVRRNGRFTHYSQGGRPAPHYRPVQRPSP